MGRVLLAVAMLLAAPGAALACPVCFGQSDSPLAIATNLGVMAMLVVVVGVLGSFAAFFVYLARRARMTHDAGNELTDLEGTARW
jgi:hypothetical protein